LFVQFLAEQPVQMAIPATPAGLVFSLSEPASVECNSVAKRSTIEIIDSILTSNPVPLSSTPTNLPDSVENMDQRSKSIEIENYWFNIEYRIAYHCFNSTSSVSDMA
jgi:hypothetical protein